MLNVASMFQQPDEAQTHESWVDGLATALGDDGEAYVNFIGDEGNGAGEAGVSGPDLGPAAGGQAPVRPDESVPAQPKHPTRRLRSVTLTADLVRPA